MRRRCQIVAALALLLSVNISCALAAADIITKEVIENETVVLRGEHSSSTTSRLRRRIFESSGEDPDPRTSATKSENLANIEEIIAEVETEAEADLEDAAKILSNIMNNTTTTATTGSSIQNLVQTAGADPDAEPATLPIVKRRRRRRKRRLCPERIRRRKCRSCQAFVRRKLQRGECSSGVVASREGRDCNQHFDACRRRTYSRCRRWKDAYDNCFLPQMVGESNPLYDATCESSCNLNVHSDIRYDLNGNEDLTIGLAVSNGCEGDATITALNYAVCTKCTASSDQGRAANGAVLYDQCSDLESLMDLYWFNNGGSTVLPASAQEYLEFTHDPYPPGNLEEDFAASGANCNFQVKIDYKATATLQVFYSDFEAEIEVDCGGSGDGSSDAAQAVQPSSALDEAFVSYFQNEEECIYADDDGCGARDVVYAGVSEIQEGECNIYDVVEPADRNLQGGTVTVSYVVPTKRKKRRRKVRIKGRNRKNGRCRRKCASRNKKVKDAVSDPNRRLQQKRLRCVDPQAEKPNLKKELQYRKEELGFAARDAAVVAVQEQECSTEAEACRDGSHGCCGTEGCTCGTISFTKENCRAGTKLDDDSIESCFLSVSGNLMGTNQCCADTSLITDECREACGL